MAQNLFHTSILKKNFEFDNTYPDGSTSTSAFKMNYPSILSVGLGYSKGDFDVQNNDKQIEVLHESGEKPPVKEIQKFLQTRKQVL